MRINVYKFMFRIDIMDKKNFQCTLLCGLTSIFFPQICYRIEKLEIRRNYVKNRLRLRRSVRQLCYISERTAYLCQTTSFVSQ